tara:strand:- start:1652 stop:1813 length:162 start_codon:yes stop_codon:yes gene_type:complete
MTDNISLDPTTYRMLDRDRGVLNILRTRLAQMGKADLYREAEQEFDERTKNVD